MDWNSALNGFRGWLRLERGLSANTLDGYLRDLEKLRAFGEAQGTGPLAITRPDLEAYLTQAGELGLGARSQARWLSAVRAFYRYLLLEDLLPEDPSDLIDGPRLPRKLPDTLSAEEVRAILEAVDLSTPEGARNRAILELLYGSGLRVREVVAERIAEGEALIARVMHSVVEDADGLLQDEQRIRARNASLLLFAHSDRQSLA